MNTKPSCTAVLISERNKHYGWVLHMLNDIEERSKILSSLLASGQFNDHIKHAGRFAGRQSSLHIETGLVSRIQAAGLSHYLQQFKVDPEVYDKQLKKAEVSMTNKPSVDLDLRKLSEASMRVKIACGFPNYKFKPTTVEYAAENQVNKQSSASFPFYIRKGKVIDQLIELAKSSRTQLGTWLWPMTRGFRIQIRYQGDTNILVPKVRVMYPYPGHIIILEDCYIIPFVKHFIENDTFYVIGRNGGSISKLLYNKLHNQGPITSLDVSSFDQDLIIQASVAAFGILRQQLTLTRDQISEFENIVKYFCTSLMVSKTKGSSSYGFIKTNGVPSGSGFTNMIDTIAHAIILEYLEPGIINKCLICGDDNIFPSKGIDLKNLFQGYKNSFNLTISIEKTKTYDSSDKISFLGFQWINYIRYVDTKLVLNQMVWHTDFLVELDKYERELARGASVLLNGINGKYLFKQLFPDVLKSLRVNADVRFVYLFGYQPPTTLPGVLSYTKVRGPQPSTNQSLLLHLNRGWAIR